MSLVYVLLVAHFVADFVCQSDWMAVNKSKSWMALTYHVAVYAAVLMMLVGWWTGEEPRTFGLWLAVNATAHFAQDAVTSRITSRLWPFPKVGEGMRPNWIQVEVRDTRHWFFVAIGADQLLHYITLFVTADWWLR